MKIEEFLCSDAVTADLQATTKEEIIKELVDSLAKAKAINTKKKADIIEVLMAREALGSTAIGQGIAIPHGKCSDVTTLVAALGISKKGIDFDSLDGEPAHIFFLLLAPTDSAGPHLKALARVSRLLKDKFFRDSLKSVGNSKEILALVSSEDAHIN